MSPPKHWYYPRNHYTVEALDERTLRSLVEYDEDFERTTYSDPRNGFGENCVSGGLQYIFDRFHLFWAVLDTPGAVGGAEWPDPPNWAIEFRERPWRHLSIRPDPTDKTSCRVFEGETHVRTYKMLGRPDQWVELVRWLWNYGNERAIAIEALAAIKARHKRANPSARRPHCRSKHKSPPPSRAHAASHLRQYTGSRSHQPVKSRGEQNTSLLSTMTLADIEEDAHIEGHVPEEMVPETYNVPQESDANRQSASGDLPKDSAIENMELRMADALEDTLAVDGDKVG